MQVVKHHLQFCSLGTIHTLGNVFIHALSKTVYFYDPMPHAFPVEVLQAFQAYRLLHDSAHTWQYIVISCAVQFDYYSCGIWAMWMAENWLQFMSELHQPPDFQQWVLPRLSTPPVVAHLRHGYFALMDCHRRLQGPSQQLMQQQGGAPRQSYLQAASSRSALDSCQVSNHHAVNDSLAQAFCTRNLHVLPFEIGFQSFAKLTPSSTLFMCQFVTLH